MRAGTAMRETGIIAHSCRPQYTRLPGPWTGRGTRVHRISEGNLRSAVALHGTYTARGPRGAVNSSRELRSHTLACAQSGGADRGRPRTGSEISGPRPPDRECIIPYKYVARLINFLVGRGWCSTWAAHSRSSSCLSLKAPVPQPFARRCSFSLSIATTFVFPEYVALDDGLARHAVRRRRPSLLYSCAWRGFLRLRRCRTSRVSTPRTAASCPYPGEVDAHVFIRAFLRMSPCCTSPDAPPWMVIVERPPSPAACVITTRLTVISTGLSSGDAISSAMTSSKDEEETSSPRTGGTYRPS